MSDEKKSKGAGPAKVAQMPVAGNDSKAAAKASGLPPLPKMPKTKKSKPPKECGCGCGDMTKGGNFIAGHDAKLHGWALRVERGVIKLDEIPHEGIKAKVKALMQTRKSEAAK